MSQEDSYNKSILDRIFFSQDSEAVKRDPNKPADSAYFRAAEKIREQAYYKWYTEYGGEYLVKHIEEEIIDLIKALVGTRIGEASPYLQQKIWDKIDFVDTIHKAFVENEK
jgi:hypothetical protein